MREQESVRASGWGAAVSKVNLISRAPMRVGNGEVGRGPHFDVKRSAPGPQLGAAHAVIVITSRF